jgi:uncharacterized metal-binding protein YceD (DUF177 family)
MRRVSPLLGRIVRFLIEHIDDRGRQVEASLADSWAKDASREALGGDPSVLSVSLDLQQKDGLVHVTGRARAGTPRSCDRCGEDTALDLDVEIDLYYAPKAAEPESHPEQELDADELDVGWYSDGEIDVADVLREAIALAVPLRVVCEDTAACDARVAALLGPPAAKETHPGLAQLKSISQNLKSR